MSQKVPARKHIYKVAIIEANQPATIGTSSQSNIGCGHSEGWISFFFQGLIAQKLADHEEMHPSLAPVGICNRLQAGTNGTRQGGCWPLATKMGAVSWCKLEICHDLSTCKPPAMQSFLSCLCSIKIYKFQVNKPLHHTDSVRPGTDHPADAIRESTIACQSIIWLQQQCRGTLGPHSRLIRIQSN